MSWFGSSGSVGSGKVFGRAAAGANAPSKRASYVGDVIKKLKTLQDSQGLSEEALSERAAELTDPEKLWSVYFSGIALDPAREHIERKLEAEEGATSDGAAAQGLPTARIPVKLRMKPVQDAGQYGMLSYTSLLLKHYGPIHASVLVDDKIVLLWNTSGLVIPTGKPIEASSDPDALPGTEEYCITEEELQCSFDSAVARKDILDKLIAVIVRYNKTYLYHSIFRSCQKFVADSVVALGYPVHPKLVGQLGDYFKEVKKTRKHKIGFETHAMLDDYVGRALESSGGGVVPDAEYLLSEYFQFHVTSMTESERPEKWVCEEKGGCCMSHLEQTVDLKQTVAYRMCRSS